MLHGHQRTVGVLVHTLKDLSVCKGLWTRFFNALNITSVPYVQYERWCLRHFLTVFFENYKCKASPCLGGFFPLPIRRENKPELKSDVAFVIILYLELVSVFIKATKKSYFLNHRGVQRKYWFNIIGHHLNIVLNYRVHTYLYRTAEKKHTPYIRRLMRFFTAVKKK